MGTTEIIMRFVSTLLFAGLGYVVSHKIPFESKVTAWLTFILGAALATGSLRDIWIVAVDQYAIYLNNALYGLGLGVLMGFVQRGKHKPTNADVHAG